MIYLGLVLLGVVIGFVAARAAMVVMMPPHTLIGSAWLAKELRRAEHERD
jgi:hypothetical protein